MRTDQEELFGKVCAQTSKVPLGLYLKILMSLGGLMSQLGAAPELLSLWRNLLIVFKLRSLMIFVPQAFFTFGATRETEEDLLRQKSRIQWLKAGDCNSSYFFKAINGRRNRSKIHSISGDDGFLIECDIPVKNEAIRHFQNILGCTMPTRHGIDTLSNIIDNVISNDQADLMDRDVTNDEIREKTWDIVGEDVINAIQEFFRSGHLFKELNATIISLVPKVPNPSMMKDFRPIFCCNTLYKIIAKIIANRIKPCLPDIISPSQSTFVAGRSIGDNILLAQELMRNYHTDISCPRLTLKVDLKKAIDMVD
ncbi:hypothetical protein LWI28_017614 [Acer negundo]|uniref:Reverse transcriptase domain-containing protein n=1 Tax=Acer negundo TaxID=4023 RepID=A0AAD5IRK4_ACENE|nr:hypothetical protein LWI28_017614 [Acer negundo]